MIESPNIGLAFTWDSNKKVLKSYVDGVVYESTTNSVSRSFWNLNYNPVKYVEGVMSNMDNTLNSTLLSNLYFKNISLDSTEPLIRGNLMFKKRCYIFFNKT